MIFYSNFHIASRCSLGGCCLGSYCPQEIAGDDPDMVFAGIDLSNPEAEDPAYEQMSDRKLLKVAPTYHTTAAEFITIRFLFVGRNF